MLNNNKIQIAILDISAQNKAVLEFYFQSAGEDFYKLVGKDKAQAFISDYDMPGAKNNIAQVLSDNNKPIIILSVKEQNIPSTIWLAKPLSATAVTQASVKLHEMISEMEESSSETQLEATSEPEKQVIENTQIDDAFNALAVTEEPITEENIQESNVEEEVVVKETLLEEVLIEKNNLEEVLAEQVSDENEDTDFFQLLTEVNQEDDDSQEGVVELTRTEDIISLNSSSKSSTKSTASVKSVIHADTSDASDDSILNFLLSEDSTETDELKDLSEEVAETDDQKDLPEETKETDDSSKLEFTDVVLSGKNTGSYDHIESDNEVDELLQSLIQGSGAKGNIHNKKIDTIDLINNDEDTIVDVMDTAELVNLADDALISELTTHETKIEESAEEQYPSIEESFTLHDDLNPSVENIYSETLEVDYSTVKTDDFESKSDVVDQSIEADELSLEFSLEGKTVSSQTEGVDIEQPLETGLFNFDLESNDSDVVTENADSDELEPKKAEFLSVVDNNDLKTQESNVEHLDLHLEEDLNVAIDDESTTDLDSLLSEVTNEDNFTDESIDSNKASFTVSDPIHTEEVIGDNEFNGSLDDELLDSDYLDENSPDFELQSLLNEVREEADKKSSSDIAPGLSGENDAYNQTEAEKRWSQLCGDLASIDEQKEVAAMSFTSQNHLLGVLVHQIEATKDREQLYRLKYKDLIIVIDHVKSKIYCNLPITTHDYSMVCFTELNPLEIKVHDLDYSEIRLYRTKMEENTDRSHSIESFIWTTSLLTSQGRLPVRTDVTKPIGLKVWPNLTRLELMPHAMHIAAVFSKHPGSLIDIAKWLNIHQRYVFAFYNAALSLNMIELDSNKIKKSSFSFGKKGSAKKSEERGFFGRLLKRLKT